MRLTRRFALACLLAVTPACGDPVASADIAQLDTRDTVDASDTSSSDLEDVAPDGAGDTADSIDAEDGKPETTGGDGVQTRPEAVQTTSQGAFSRTIVDAQDGTLWVHVAFATGALRIPATDLTWDVAFQRYLVKLGPGASVATLDTVAFDELTTAPADGYTVDAADPKLSADYALGEWYDYDGRFHTLSPKPGRVYVVRTASGDAFKLRFRDYYDAAGNPGVLTLDWAPVAPAVSDTVFAPTTEATYLDLASRTVVAADAAWDLAVLQGVAFRTAGGTSADAHGGARLANGTFATVTATDTIGFLRDAVLPLSVQPGAPTASRNPAFDDWYDYDPATHQLSPKAHTYLVRGRDGDTFKVRIASWSNEGVALQVAPVERRPLDHELVLAASGPVHADLANASLVTFTNGETPSSLTTWDLAAHSVSLQTNGGTSGAGLGGAQLLGDAAFESYTSLPTEGYVADTELPIAGPPGSGNESRNAALDAWYAYDPSTHTVSPSNKVFAVRLADGSLARLTVTTYASGTLTVRFTYAGPGQSTL